MDTIIINGQKATVDAATAGTVRFALRRFAALPACDRLYVANAANGYFAAIRDGESSDFFLGMFEGRMGFRSRTQVQMSWAMDAILDWFEDGYSFYPDGNQRR